MLLLLATVLISVASAFLEHWSAARPLAERFRTALNGGEAGDSVIFRLVAACLIYLAIGLAVWIVARLRGGGAWRDLIAWRPWIGWLRRRAFWLLVGATLAYSGAADLAIAYFAPEARGRSAIPEGSAAVTVLVAFLAVGFAPIVEELVFRGWIFTDLRRRFGFIATLLTTSAIFAGLHHEDTHIYALAIFPIGLGLGALRELTGSVKAPIALHALNNFIGVFLRLAS